VSLAINVSYSVKHYMNRKVATIEDHISVTDAAKAMVRSGKGYLIVVKGSQPLGIVTERDFVGKVIASEREAGKVSVAEIMSSPLVTVGPNEDLLKASEIMRKRNIRRLPVVENEVIHGVITARDIARRLGEYIDRATKDLTAVAIPFTRIADF